MIKELGLNFEFRTSSPNEVSTDYMKNTHRMFCSLSYPYVLKSNPNVTILNYWCCLKKTKHLYQRVRFRVTWDSDATGGRYGKSHLGKHMKSEFGRLNKAYVLYSDPVNNPSPNQCLSGYTFSGCDIDELSGEETLPLPGEEETITAGFPVVPVIVGLVLLGIGFGIWQFTKRRK